MPAILLGSLSTLADTSELQRDAFNKAFADHGLSWTWERDTYAALLADSGGKDRISGYAAAREEEVDAAAVHATKSELFHQGLAEARPELRPGVHDAIRRARVRGYAVALVTTTSPENVAALLDAVAPSVGADDFDLVIDTSHVAQVKPDPAAYTFALAQLGLDIAETVAVEDNLGGVASATSAGVTCLAFPNANTAGHDFPAARGTVDRLDFAHLDEIVSTF